MPRPVKVTLSEMTRENIEKYITAKGVKVLSKEELKEKLASQTLPERYVIVGEIAFWPNDYKEADWQADRKGKLYQDSRWYWASMYEPESDSPKKSVDVNDIPF
jgi:tRNA G37 N-methylase Trm5